MVQIFARNTYSGIPLTGVVGPWSQLAEREAMARNESESIQREITEAEDAEHLESKSAQQLFRVKFPPMDGSVFLALFLALLVQHELRRERLRMGANDWAEEQHMNSVQAWERNQMGEQDPRHHRIMQDWHEPSEQDLPVAA